MSINVSIDAYGKYGRLSALADYLEYNAARKTTYYVSNLIDLSKDLGWLSKPLFHTLGGDSTELGDPELAEPSEELAELLDAKVRERHQLLEELYPFEVVGSGMSLQLVLIDQEPKPYLSLLGMTLAHAYGVDTPQLKARTVEDAFEELVSSTLAATGIRNYLIPTYGGKGLPEKMSDAASSLGLKSTPERAHLSAYGKDGGADIVAHVPSTPSPSRIPTFVLLGQATCGSSECWDRKARELPTVEWRDTLGMKSDPATFLAVPHEVDTNYRRRLSNTGSAIIDRMHLTAMGASLSLSHDTTQILQAVFG